MKTNDDKRVVYSLNVADIQEVSKSILGRRLSQKEIQLVEFSFGNYIDWTQAIENAINKCLRDRKEIK